MTHQAFEHHRLDATTYRTCAAWVIRLSMRPVPMHKPCAGRVSRSVVSTVFRSAPTSGAHDLYPALGWRHFWSALISLAAVAEERARYSGRRPSKKTPVIKNTGCRVFLERPRMFLEQSTQYMLHAFHHISWLRTRCGVTCHVPPF